MKPGEMMWLGAASGIVAAMMSIFGGDLARVPTVMLFAAGAVFGKGYGVWEERSGRNALEKERGE